MYPEGIRLAGFAAGCTLFGLAGAGVVVGVEMALIS
jgi:hypothetical protein